MMGDSSKKQIERIMAEQAESSTHLAAQEVAGLPGGIMPGVRLSDHGGNLMLEEFIKVYISEAPHYVYAVRLPGTRRSDYDGITLPSGWLLTYNSPTQRTATKPGEDPRVQTLTPGGVVTIIARMWSETAPIGPDGKPVRWIEIMPRLWLTECNS